MEPVSNRESLNMAERVLIVGGGLAGLAAAESLAPRGFEVRILESRGRLGGRAGSFQDGSSGQLIDACQHVSMGCCTNLAHFCRQVGIDHLIEPQPTLYFMTPDRRISRFQSDPLPAPLHLARSFLRAHYLTLGEKVRIALALRKLEREPIDEDPPFLDWLKRQRQTERMISRFWGLVLTSALNESTTRIGLRYARKVFVDGFLTHRRGFDIEVPSVPLGRLYGEELQGWMARHGVEIKLQAAVRSVEFEGERVSGLFMRQGENHTADWYILTVPFDRLLDMLPPDQVEAHACFRNARQLETSPITSVHLWYDRPVTSLPHVVLIDCLSQWVFNRGEIAPGEHYLQVVVSAARELRGLGHDEIERRVRAELASLFPEAKEQAIKRARVVTEQAATFSAVPGVDRWRPNQETPIRNLFLAGDWTATGWPATMEGAVRSGRLAAQALLKRSGQEVQLVVPDL
jgi:squalene-associated FAD-dependent desaturase